MRKISRLREFLSPYPHRECCVDVNVRNGVIETQVNDGRCYFLLLLGATHCLVLYHCAPDGKLHELPQFTFVRGAEVEPPAAGTKALHRYPQ